MGAHSEGVIISTSVLDVKKAGGSKILQITKVHERRSKCNAVNMLHTKHWRGILVAFLQHVFSYLTEGLKEELGVEPPSSSTTKTLISTNVCQVVWNFGWTLQIWLQVHRNVSECFWTTLLRFLLRSLGLRSSLVSDSSRCWVWWCICCMCVRFGTVCVLNWIWSGQRFPQFQTAVEIYLHFNTLTMRAH